MNKLKPWVKLPSRWIENKELRGFRWGRGEGSNNLAGLMALAAISHQADGETGTAQLTYDALCEATTLSRSKLSAGLSILVERGQLERGIVGRSSFRLAGYDPKLGWAQFPALGLYQDRVIAAFRHLHLRQPAELDALKLYFLFASRRDRKTNVAKITYERIEDYSGVGHNSVRRALSWLTLQGLVHVERVRSRISEDGVANAYRLAHLDTRRHMGTSGRNDEFWEEDDP